MRVTEEQRRALFDRVRAHLDEETAALLLEVTVPANVELATRTDIHELRAEILLAFAALEGRLTERFAGVEERFAGVEERFAGVEQRFAGVDERIAGVEKRLGAVEERLTGVEAQVKALGTELLGKIYWVVIPVLAAVNVAILGLATWVGTLVG